jgi:hypothetical protein
MSEWGDCYRVVALLEPSLLACYRESENRPDLWFYFDIPFDPNDAERWKHNAFFHKLYRNAQKLADRQLGIRVDRVDGKVFFQTHKNYNCEEKQ